MAKFEFGRGVRQDVVAAYLKYPNGTVHPDYEKKTATVTVDGVDQGVLIFGEMGSAICQLACGAKASAFKTIINRI
ncbi:MAG: hypothetical protein IJ272_00090 [Clostridia bacterium]|nr:hypothetical protein [Clostridia bacterium]